jgi:Fe-S-cluster containining protein
MKPFKCDRCGYCCTLRARLSFIELLRILLKGYKKKDFVIKDMKGRNCIKQLENKDCYFLTRKNGKTYCRIYKIRPKMCREYPGFEQGRCQDKIPEVKEYLHKLSSQKL